MLHLRGEPEGMRDIKDPWVKGYGLGELPGL